jgi:4a-hydroxytetrahydrobiopterin dehydratase
MDLTKKKCEPCEGGTKPFNKNEAQKYLPLLKTEWELVEEDEFKIRKKYKFETFRQAIDFINKVADLAEKEDHHPNIFNSYTRVTITLFTHSIGGLSINDFIVASKIELLK